MPQVAVLSGVLCITFISKYLSYIKFGLRLNLDQILLQLVDSVRNSGQNDGQKSVAGFAFPPGQIRIPFQGRVHFQQFAPDVGSDRDFLIIPTFHY